MEYFKTALDFMVWIVFAIAAVPAALVLGSLLLGTRPARPARDANPEKKLKCQALGIALSEQACRFHRTMCPEACVNCPIAQGEAA